MQTLSSPYRFVGVSLCALLAACAGGSSPFAPHGAEALLAPAVMKTASASKITVDDLGGGGDWPLDEAVWYKPTGAH